MVIWELRFIDGRGSSVYTTADVTSDIGKPAVVRTIEIAAAISQSSALRDAESCLRSGRTLHLTAHMGAVAYAAQHQVED